MEKHGRARPTRPGTFDSESGRQAARMRWASAEKDADAAAVVDQTAEPGSRSVELSEGQAAGALAVLESIANDRKAGASARVAAARALADLEIRSEVPLPRTVEAIQRMSTPDLYRLVSRLEKTQPLPPELEEALSD